MLNQSLNDTFNMLEETLYATKGKLEFAEKKVARLSADPDSMEYKNACIHAKTCKTRIKNCLKEIVAILPEYIAGRANSHEAFEATKAAIDVAQSIAPEMDIDFAQSIDTELAFGHARYTINYVNDAMQRIAEFSHKRACIMDQLNHLDHMDYYLPKCISKYLDPISLAKTKDDLNKAENEAKFRFLDGGRLYSRLYGIYRNATVYEVIERYFHPKLEQYFHEYGLSQSANISQGQFYDTKSLRAQMYQKLLCLHDNMYSSRKKVLKYLMGGLLITTPCVAELLSYIGECESACRKITDELHMLKKYESEVRVAKTVTLARRKLGLSANA